MDKSTTILVFNNKHLHHGKCVKCKVTDKDGISICHKIGKPHVTFPGSKGDNDKGQCKTNAACQYPLPFCEVFADIVYALEVNPHSRKAEPVIGLTAAVKLELPPAGHYTLHLPKHHGCTACMSCKAGGSIAKTWRRHVVERPGRPSRLRSLRMTRRSRSKVLTSRESFEIWFPLAPLCYQEEFNVNGASR